MKMLKFKDNKGHILVEEDYITLFDSVNIEKSRKWAMSRVDSANIKLIHDILKIANLGKLYLTDEALEKFDDLVESWEE